MASTVMATAKATPSLSSSSSTRKPSIVAQFKPQPTSNLSLKKLLSPKLLLSTIPSIAMIATTTPLPALAAQMEKAKIFDFNLTLPIIAIEFLLLMVALDKLYFTPLGKFMDDRDAKIRAELNEVKDTSSEVKELEEQARAIMRAARAEVAAAANKKMKESTEEMEAQLAEGQARLEIELKEAIAELDRQKDEAYTILNAQIEALSDEIVNLVMPNTEELVEEEQVAST